MVILHRDELFKLAELTALKLSDAEADALLVDLQNLINYTDELASVELKPERKLDRNVNILRDDVALQPQSSNALLAQAPKTNESYFVVPQIIDDKESS